MRILLIGDNSLRNNAIQKVLSLRQGWHIEHITPSLILDGYEIPSDGQFAVCLLDISSCLDDCKEIITKIHQPKLSCKLAVIFNALSEEEVDSLQNNGVDECLSVEWETDKFVRTIAELGNN